MQRMYQEFASQLDSSWKNTLNNVSDDYIKSIWTREGDIGTWRFVIESSATGKHHEEVHCLLDLSIGKRYAAQMYVLKKLASSVGPTLVIQKLQKNVKEIVRNDLKGGYLCKNC